MKYFKTQENFLTETILNEIGDSKPLAWEKTNASGKETFYEFDSSNIHYTVTIKSTNKNNIDIQYTANGFAATITNAGNPLEIFATVLDILKEHLQDNPGITSFSFIPEKNIGSNDNRREKIYTYGIKRAFPNAKIVSKKIAGSEMEYKNVKVVL